PRKLRAGRLRWISRGRLMAVYVGLRWRMRGLPFLFGIGQHRHNLPGKLFLTLTSHSPRFTTLALTLKCLLMRRLRADGVYLWIATEDMPKLPESLLELQHAGLCIKPCRDVRPYTKLIPALHRDPEAFWVTVDDDCYYPATMLEALVGAWGHARNSVICRRAHRMTFDAQGSLRPYAEWEWEVKEAGPSDHLFFTGVGGVLYSPGCFHKAVL